MKGLFKQIFEYLSIMGMELNDLNAKLKGIPNSEDI
jgi:hypothetical protein